MQFMVNKGWRSLETNTSRLIRNTLRRLSLPYFPVARKLDELLDVFYRPQIPVTPASPPTFVFIASPGTPDKPMAFR